MELAGGHAGALHLLITDVVMPGMNGHDLTRRLVRDRPGLRVLFISGYGDERVEVSGPIGPDVAFPQKPLSPAALARQVRDLLDTPASGPAGT